MVTLSIDRKSKKSVYEQVASQVRQLVASGALAPGATLPSVRQLAGDLGVNLNTIARAYRLLKDEGFLVIRDRAGVTVSAPAENIGHADKTRLMDQLCITLVQLRQAGVAPDELLEAVRSEIQAMNNTIVEHGNE
jgi:DNA-binding transcriptional regulator YhcF (GntR family)